MRRLLLAIVLAVGLVAAGPTPARAQATSPFDDAGACTAVPDELPGIFDFTDACVRHDACYALGADRLACDTAFRQDMLQLCVAQHPEALDVGRLVCFTFAELYFLGVRLFGGLAFG
ncbi:MAG TPA: phospholipase A2 [Acidimicrobiales bacterium]